MPAVGFCYMAGIFWDVETKPATPGRGRPAARPDGAGGVQSIERALDLLEYLTDAGGSQGLSQLAASSGLPLPTIHRLMKTLMRRGYVRQEPSRRYALGPRLIRLGDTAGKLLGSWSRPYLEELVEFTGETANLALMDGDEVVYVAQAPSRHQMRMFTEPGRRVRPHCTAVGKALLAQMSEADVRALLRRTGMEPHTVATITDPDELVEHLALVREQGYARDEGEQEIGVRCIAVHVPDAPTMMAISVSGPQARLSENSVDKIVPALERVAGELAERIAQMATSGAA
jgi:IclR family transcriptional regulator, acetate operon repressor